jgi:hypothetical protein
MHDEGDYLRLKAWRTELLLVRYALVVGPLPGPVQAAELVTADALAAIAFLGDH